MIGLAEPLDQVGTDKAGGSSYTLNGHNFNFLRGLKIQC